MMRYLLVLLIGIIGLSGCVTTQHFWVENFEGNQLSITQQALGYGRRLIEIQNTNRTWVGSSLTGGEEKVEKRKKFLEQIAIKEARKVCSPDTPIQKSETGFSMVEQDDLAYGGGLIGYAIASAAADYKNLPTAAYYYYNCPKDKANSSGAADAK